MASPACRKLQFGDSEGSGLSSNPENSVHNKADMPVEEERAERQRAIDKWNFDFENEVPLQGDWVWERVDPVEVPENKAVVAAMQERKNENLRNI